MTRPGVQWTSSIVVREPPEPQAALGSGYTARCGAATLALDDGLDESSNGMSAEISLPQIPDGTPVRQLIALFVSFVENASHGDMPSSEDAQHARDAAESLNQLWNLIEFSHTQLRDTAENALRNYSQQIEQNSQLLDEIRQRDEEIDRLKEQVESLTRRN